MIADARRAIASQITSLQRTSDLLGPTFDEAVELIVSSSKVVATGLGKSGFIARKLAATLASIRIPSTFLHPVDALHGDSGILESTDVLIAFSKSGETAEVVRLVDVAASIGMKIIVITCRQQSTLAERANAAVIASIEREFDAYDVLPTASTTTSLVIADCLAVAAASVRGDVEGGLRSTHPQGTIGSTFLRTVDEVMHSGERLPRVTTEATMAESLAELTAKGLGIVCIVDHDDHLVGIITDGDVRRAMAQGANVATTLPTEVMTRSPRTITPSATLHEALTIMERGERQIGVLPVVLDGVCVGVLRLHDIVRMSVTQV